jgi:excinuclease ABC subunit B
MQRAIDETNRRRERQLEYNEAHGITPESIKKAIRRGIEEEIAARKIERTASGKSDETAYVTQEFLAELEAEMLAAAENLEYERAGQIRDQIAKLRGDPVAPKLQIKKRRGRKSFHRGSPS